MGLTSLLVAVIRLYMVVIVVRAVFSWLPLRHRQNELYRFVLAITEPVLQPVRRVLPPLGGVDWSPIVVLVLASLIARFLQAAAY